MENTRSYLCPLGENTQSDLSPLGENAQSYLSPLGENTQSYLSPLDENPQTTIKQNMLYMVVNRCYNFYYLWILYWNKKTTENVS